MTDQKPTDRIRVLSQSSTVMTPEQVITATLGDRPTKSGRGYYTDRDDEGTHIMCDSCGEYIGTAEEIAAMLGSKACHIDEPDTIRNELEDSGQLVGEQATLGSGKLTAEQVRKAIFEHSIYASYDGAKYYADGIDMQAIADELNAVLGSETCETVYAVGGIIAQAECYDVCAGISEFTCSACGFNCDLTSWISLFDGDDGRRRHHHHGTPNYCPNCGAKVRKAVSA